MSLFDSSFSICYSKNKEERNMAKKKSSSKKNRLSWLWDILSIAVGGAILGFLALPHIKYETSNVITGTTTENISAYQLMSFEEGANIGLSTVILILIITASLLCFCGLLKLVADMGIVKNATFAKVAGFGMVVAALATLALAITLCIMVSGAVKDDSFNLGGYLSAGRYAVWGILITNACVAFVGFITSLFAVKK